jgi:hypothetical protein
MLFTNLAIIKYKTVLNDYFIVDKWVRMIVTDVRFYDVQVEYFVN